MQKLKIFEKSMNRREFLGHSGSFLLALLGVGGVIRFLLHNGGGGSSQLRGGGYGASAYGGKPKGILAS